MTQDNLADQFKKNGFVLVKNVFSPEEIGRLRQICEEYRIEGEVNLPTDNFSFQKIRDFIVDERVLGPIRKVLGPDLVYFGEGSISFSAYSPPHFHKDARADPYDPQDNDYPVVRIGIYMQDHKNHSGGLKVRIGSHRHVHLVRRNLKRIFKSNDEQKRFKLSSFKVGKSYNLPIEVGDLAIWSLRTDHSPNAVRLKIAPNLSINPVLEPYIPKFMRVPEEKERIVLFNTFGIDHELHDNYLYQRLDKMPRNWWENSSFDDKKTIAQCKKSNLALRFDGLNKARNRAAE